VGVRCHGPGACKGCVRCLLGPTALSIMPWLAASSLQHPPLHPPPYPTPPRWQHRLTALHHRQAWSVRPTCSSCTLPLNYMPHPPTHHPPPHHPPSCIPHPPTPHRLAPAGSLHTPPLWHMDWCPCLALALAPTPTPAPDLATGPFPASLPPPPPCPCLLPPLCRWPAWAW
jgi:hypothetical protein